MHTQVRSHRDLTSTFAYQLQSITEPDVIYSSPCCYFNCFNTVLPSRSGSRTLGIKYTFIRLH